MWPYYDQLHFKLLVARPPTSGFLSIYRSNAAVFLIYEVEFSMKFFSKPIPEHEEVPLADEGAFEDIVEDWSQRDEDLVEDEGGVYVLSVGWERDPQIRQAQLAEIIGLVEAQGDDVLGHEIYTLNKTRPKTLIGKGTARAVAERARACGANMLILDAELSPSQMRNLEDEAGIKICDREAVILNVFLRHASSRRARIQVEIAQLEYLRPRIRGVGIDMDQQMGGVAGSRGPGETASELLGRQLDNRLMELRRAYAKIKTADSNRRQRREGCQTVALVGYTNAGKTSLMNALTLEKFSSADRPFETLDTVSRSLSRHGERVLISDTVGFIRRLPERLLESFESTLAEAKEASLLAIVVDLSDYEWREHLNTTLQILNRLGAGDVPRFFVFNKIDLVDIVPSQEALKEIVGDQPFQLISSKNEDSVEALRSELLETLRRAQVERCYLIPYSASHVLSLIYAGCRVLHTESEETGLRITFEGYPSVVGRIEKELKGVSV